MPAFLLARRPDPDRSPLPAWARDERSKTNEEFGFKAAKRRVALMEIRYVPETDPALRARRMVEQQSTSRRSSCGSYRNQMRQWWPTIVNWGSTRSPKTIRDESNGESSDFGVPGFARYWPICA